MNIGEAAARSGLPPKTIRYYEDVALIPPPARTEAGYRAYSERDVHLLRFIHAARSLGFSLRECRELVSLWRDPHRTGTEVKAIALATLGRIERKIAELEAMRATLADLAAKCHGTDRPDCPILEGIAARGADAGEAAGTDEQEF